MCVAAGMSYYAHEHAAGHREMTGYYASLQGLRASVTGCHTVKSCCSLVNCLLLTITSRLLCN